MGVDFYDRRVNAVGVHSAEGLPRLRGPASYLSSGNWHARGVWGENTCHCPIPASCSRRPWYWRSSAL